MGELEKYNLKVLSKNPNEIYTLYGDLYFKDFNETTENINDFNNSQNSRKIVFGLQNSITLDKNLILGQLTNNRLEFYNFILGSNIARAYHFDLNTGSPILTGAGNVFSINKNKHYFEKEYIKMILDLNSSSEIKEDIFEKMNFERIYNFSIFKDDKHKRFKFKNCRNLEIQLIKTL